MNAIQRRAATASGEQGQCRECAIQPCDTCPDGVPVADTRPVTAREDKVLRAAAKASSKRVAPGKMAEGSGVAPCGSHQCIAGQRDGVLCADGECDRENGVRPDGVRGTVAPSKGERCEDCGDTLPKRVCYCREGGCVHAPGVPASADQTDRQ